MANKCRLDCLTTSIPEVKCPHCIKAIQKICVIIKAKQTICIHHAMKTPKAKLISAKSKYAQEIQNRDQTCPG